MTKRYGADIRVDPSHILEQQVTQPIRQTVPTRVTETLTSFTSVILLVGDPQTFFTNGADITSWDEFYDPNALIAGPVTNIPVPNSLPGVYRIFCRIRFEASGGTTDDGTRTIKIFKGSTEIATTTVNAIAGTAFREVQVAVSNIVTTQGANFKVRASWTGGATNMGCDPSTAETYFGLIREL